MGRLELFNRFGSRIEQLRQDFLVDNFVVAFSGGQDSTVLLDLVVKYFGSNNDCYSIVHIDHKLHFASGAWAEHCKAVASDMRRSCVVLQLDPHQAKPNGLEAWARASRYKAFASFVRSGTCLLTAHHAEDQAETILHHAVQGAGPYGLSGMPSTRKFGDGYLARPLLDTSFADIKNYALDCDLKWVEDPSNNDEKFLRNSLRKNVLPVLKSIIPNAANGLVRMGEIQQELLDGLNQIIDTRLDGYQLPKYQIDVEVFSLFPRSLHPYILKRVIANADIDIPGSRHIDEILKMSKSLYRASPVVCWCDSEARLFSNYLYFMKNIPKFSSTSFPWIGFVQPLELPGGRLSFDKVVGNGLSRSKIIGNLPKITFRRGGELCQLGGRLHRHKLKKLFQGWKVPPWERSFVPIIEINKKIVMVGPYFMDQNYMATGKELGFVPKWESNLYPT